MGLFQKAKPDRAAQERQRQIEEENRKRSERLGLQAREKYAREQSSLGRISSISRNILGIRERA